MTGRNTSEVILFKSLDFIPIPILLSESRMNEMSGRIQRIHRFVNHAFIEQIGYTLVDIPDMDAWFNTVYPDPLVRQAMIEGWAKIVESSINAGIDTAEMQARILCRNGEYRWFLITAQITTENQSDLHIVTMRDIHDLQLLIDENQTLSNTDVLTGLANRRKAEAVLENALSTANGSDFCLLMCDVDYFKAINDTFGHLCGDDVLVQVARLLEGLQQSAACIARWGGEEFLIVLQGYSLDETYQIAEQLRLDLASTDFFYQDKKLNLTMSFGCIRVQDNESLRSALFRVDSALYSAKSAGRNCVVIG
ncbi:GGDEF domain-containing protein [Shewanella oncorhynchi]|uniref:GGDEF domain-containing protein n=1 Tax=Shewanella oncorhynchi TaxID=2726434 RepID=UPI0037471A9A